MSPYVLAVLSVLCSLFSFLAYQERCRIPDAHSGISTPLPNNWKRGGYLKRLRDDPWKRPYQYLNPGIHSEIDIFSYGADGQPGGEEINAEIGNWNI